MEYIKPVIFDLDEIAEGVYASGSGNSTCWTIDYTVPQTWNGAAKVFEIKCSHSKAVAHESFGLVAILCFDNQLVDAYAENSTDFKVTNYGNSVKIERKLYGNAFYSGDEVTFKLFVACKTKEATETVNIIGKTIDCVHN